MPPKCVGCLWESTTSKRTQIQLLNIRGKFAPDVEIDQCRLLNVQTHGLVNVTILGNRTVDQVDCASGVAVAVNHGHELGFIELLIAVFAVTALESPLQPLDAVGRSILVDVEAAEAKQWIEIHAHFAVGRCVSKDTWTLIKDARGEIRRVVWPTRDETVQTTLIVLVLVLIFALILWLLDSGLSWVVSSILR